MRAVLWIIISLAAMALTVGVSALMSDPTLVEAGKPEQQVANYAAVADAVDEARVRQCIRDLAAFGSRVTGYPGAKQAAGYIAEAFREIGLQQSHCILRTADVVA